MPALVEIFRAVLTACFLSGTCFEIEDTKGPWPDMDSCARRLNEMKALIESAPFVFGNGPLTSASGRCDDLTKKETA